MFTSLTHATLSCLGQTAAVKSIPEAIVVCPCLYVLVILVMIAYVPYHDEDSDKEEEARHQDNVKEEKEDVKNDSPLYFEPVSSAKPAPLNNSLLQTSVARPSMNLKVSVLCSYTAKSNGRQPFKKTLQDANHWYDLTYPKTISDANLTAKPMAAIKEEEHEEEEQKKQEEPDPLAAIDQAMNADNEYMDIDDEYMDVDEDAYMMFDDDPMDVVDDMDIDDLICSAPNNQTSQEVCKPIPMDIDSSGLLSRPQSPPRPSTTIQSREPANRPPPPRRAVPIAVSPRDRDHPTITRPAAEPAEPTTTGGVPVTTTTTTAAGGASQTTNAKVVADNNVPQDDPPTSSSMATVTTTPHSAPSTSTQRPLSMVQRAALNKLRQNADKKIREKMKNRS